MKRLSLAAQISIIFVTAFLMTSIFLGIFITRQLDELFDDYVYDKLEAEAKALRLSRNFGDFEPADDIAYIRYIRSEETYYTSENLMEYMNQDAIQLLLGKALAQTAYQERYENTVNGGHIYYVVINYQGILDYNEDVLITIADSSVKTSLVNRTRNHIYFLCILTFLFGYILVLIWIYKFIGETRRISLLLKKIGDNHYKTKISTKRKDEIRDLVDDIENMRLKIIENERLRQEVIQGVSHDLKTPISLISSYAEAYEDGMCEADEMAHIAKKEAKRLITKVTKLLNLTRLGYIDTNIKTVKKTDMKELLLELIELYNYQDKIKIEADLKKSEFTGDRESWFIAVQNILDNAMRYAKSTIIIKLSDNKLFIQNDGKKIDEKILPSMFEAYKKSNDGNFGIGLSIVKRTVDIFGYKIKARNCDEQVCFEIYK